MRDNGTGQKPAIVIRYDAPTMALELSFDQEQIPIGWDGVLMVLDSAKRSAEHELNVHRAMMLKAKMEQASQEQALRSSLKLG